MKDLLNGVVRFEGVKGVGTIQVNKDLHKKMLAETKNHFQTA